MYEDLDREFFDRIYQIWSMTSSVDTHYWMPEAHTDHSGRWNIFACYEQEAPRTLVASGLSEADADFITLIHGALPELIRRLHDAVDEAALKDEARDEAEGLLADVVLENIGLRAELYELEREANQ